MLICSPGYSAKQEFVFLTTMPEAEKLRGEKHFPEVPKVSTRFVPLTGILLSFRNTAQGPSCGSGCSQWLLQVPTYVIAASFMGQAENPKSEHLIYDSAHPEIEHQHGATVDIPTLQSFVVCIKL
jgi:hypothetical protein